MLIPLTGIFFLCYVLMEESPNYLLFSQKDFESCKRTLFNIAKMNLRTYKDSQIIIHYLDKIKNKMAWN